MPASTLRVLLIDDDPVDAKLLGGMLTSASSVRFEVQIAGSLKTGLTLLKSRHIDVVLLDLDLPDSQGLQTLSQAIAASAATPIIVLAGDNVTPTTLERIKIGGREYLNKSGLDANALLECVLRHAPRSLRETTGVDPRTEAAIMKTVRVLVVEDNYGDLALIRLMLSSERTVKFEIVHASKLSIALDMLRSADVVLLDLNLPDSEGLRTLQRVRERDSAVPVIVLTGGEDRQKALEALANGAQDYLVKGQVDGYLLGRTILRRVSHKDSGGAVSG